VRPGGRLVAKLAFGRAPFSVLVGLFVPSNRLMAGRPAGFDVAVLFRQGLELEEGRLRRVGGGALQAPKNR